MKTFPGKCLIFLALFCICSCIRLRIPIGIISEPDDMSSLTIMKYGLWLQDRRYDWPKQYVVEIVKETSAKDNLTQLDRAVCRLLKQGVYAVIAPLNAASYHLLASYSSDYELPLLSPSLPEVSRDALSKFTVGIQPSTTRAILDLIRNYDWEHLVYLYDDLQGPERLQQIYQLGYGVFEVNVLGIQKAMNAEQVNQYFRKIEQAKRHRTLHVILDMDPHLAKDIIIRHVHDIFVGKNNYHFLLASPVLEEFWSTLASEVGSMNVTGFLALPVGKDKDFLNEWMKLDAEQWPHAGDQLNAHSYFYRDAVYLLGEALRSLFRGSKYKPPKDQDLYHDHTRVRECLQSPSVPLPLGQNLTYLLKKGLQKDVLTGGALEFDALGKRRNFEIPIIEIFGSKQRTVGSWSDSHGLYVSSSNDMSVPVALPRKEKKRYIITSILSSPFLMLRGDWNSTAIVGNDKYEGHSKDLMDLLANELDFEYEIKIVSDGQYGMFRKSEGQWTGMIGEIIRGNADIAVADLSITAERLQVVDFMDSHMTASLNILMKNPVSLGSWPSLYIVGAFSASVWVCILLSALIIVVLFHATSKFTGAPDTIEAASGVWGKKFSARESIWFVFGSGLFLGTGIYPRSISSRILGAASWCFILMLTALFVASVTTQLRENNGDVVDNSPQLKSLKSLSLESLVMESIRNQWPALGVVKDGSTHRYIKESSLPFLKDYEAYLSMHPEVFVSKQSEGVKRVQQSNGAYGLFMASPYGEYYSSQSACDTVAVRDIIDVFYYGIVVPLGSPLRSALNAALKKIKDRGELNYLEQTWFYNRMECAAKTTTKNNFPRSLNSFSGLLCLLSIGLVIITIVGVLQFYWKVRRKNRERKNVSFEEITMPHNLPLPPPELLRDASSDEDNGPIDGWAERKLVPTSFGQEPRSNDNVEE